MFSEIIWYLNEYHPVRHHLISHNYHKENNVVILLIIKLAN